MFLEDVLGPLDGMYQNTGIIYICAVSTNTTTNNTYLGTAEGGFQKRYYNHKTSFQNRPRKLSKYIWEMRERSCTEMVSIKRISTLLKHHKKKHAVSSREILDY